MSDTAYPQGPDPVVADNLRRHVTWLSGVRRDTGGLGEDRTVDYIVRTLQECGVETEVHEFDAFLSYPIRGQLEIVSSGKIIPAVTHSFGTSTPPEGISAELMYCPVSNMTGCRGRAVLIDGLLSPGKVLEASRSGAACVVFSHPDWFVHNMICSTVWGTPGPNQLDCLPTIPVLSINRDHGMSLKTLLADGPVTVRVETEVRTGWFRSRLPVAHVRGTTEPDLFVLVGGHYCAWGVGTTDNATGNALLLELARRLKQAQLSRSVRIAWWPGHSHGRYSGSTWYADNLWDDLAKHCLAYHNVDSPGVRGATEYVARHTTAELEGMVTGVVRELTGQRDVAVHRPSRAADQSFLAIGVPAFSCYPFLAPDHPDRREWTGGSGTAWWWHTEYDTEDKYDPKVLVRDAAVSETLVRALCDSVVLPLDFAVVCADLADSLNAIAAAAEGHLDMGRLCSLAGRFESLVTELGGVGAHLEGEAAGICNEGLIRLSRIVNPVLYSIGGRFRHDPAYLTPVMRGSASAILPGLADALTLADLAGDGDYGFVRAGLIREMNRLADALEQASTCVEGLLADLALDSSSGLSR